MGDIPPRQLPLFRPDATSEQDDPPLPVPLSPLPSRMAGTTASQTNDSNPDGEQASLFDRPAGAISHTAGRPTRLRTYLELAEAVGLRQLQTILELPPTCFVFDPSPLQKQWYLDTLLEVRERIVAHLRRAFDDLASDPDPTTRQASLALWAATRRRALCNARLPSHVLHIIACTGQPEALQPFLLRVEGFPGFAGAHAGPPPLEVGAELLAVRHLDRLFHLFPVELQPIPLGGVLVG